MGMKRVEKSEHDVRSGSGWVVRCASFGLFHGEYRRAILFDCLLYASRYYT